MPQIKGLPLIRVEICVALDLFESLSVGHQHHIKVPRHDDGGLENWDWCELANAIDKSDEADCQHDCDHGHKKLFLAFAQVIDHILHACLHHS